MWDGLTFLLYLSNLGRCETLSRIVSYLVPALPDLGTVANCDKKIDDTVWRISNVPESSGTYALWCIQIRLNSIKVV